MRKTLLVLPVLILTSLLGRAQQDPQYTQFMFDRLSVNPGYAGMGGGICGTMFYRDQWMGFSGVQNPQTFMFNGHAPLNHLITSSRSEFVNSSSIGLTFYNDKLGFETNNILRLSYAYQRPLGVGTLSGGIAGGIFNKSLQDDWVTPQDPVGDDQAIPDSKVSNTTYDLSFGLYYQTDRLWMGLSSTHLTQSGLNYEEGDYDLDMKMQRHYYVMAGYDHFIGGDQKYILKPAVLAKSDAASTQVDVSVRLLYDQMLWGGVAYRPGDAISPMVGYKTSEIGPGELKVGVSYDATTSELNNYSNGSIEIMLNYCFNVDTEIEERKYRSVRFL